MTRDLLIQELQQMLMGHGSVGRNAGLPEAQTSHRGLLWVYAGEVPCANHKWCRTFEISLHSQPQKGPSNASCLYQHCHFMDLTKLNTGKIDCPSGQSVGP